MFKFSALRPTHPHTHTLLISLCTFMLSMPFMVQSLSALSLSSAGISNITRISAEFHGVLTETNGTGSNVDITVYWGTSDAGTNDGAWPYSCTISNVSLGAFSTNLVDLTPARQYYCRPFATEGTNTAWAAATTSFWTLAGAPTNPYPAATGGVFMVVGTNGEFLAPAKSTVISANDLATGTSVSSQVATVQSNLDLIVSQTNQIIDVNGVSYTITNAPASAGDVLVFDSSTTTAQFVAQTTNLSGFNNDAGFVTNAPTNQIIAVDGIAYTITNAPASAQDVLVFDSSTTTAQFVAQTTNLSGFNNDAGFVTNAPTNQIIVVDGTAYIITNAPASAGDVLVFDPASTTAYFSAQAGGGLTLEDVKNASPLMTERVYVAIGNLAASINEGVAIGRSAQASGYGIALGRSSIGLSDGVGIGRNANGNASGVSVGYGSIANTYGAAVGHSAYAPFYAGAFGHKAWSTNGSAAVGAYVTNTIPETTRVRGDLYLDGGMKIYTRETFNSGEFTELAAGGAPTAGTYPVFRLDVGAAAGNWTDFEIKASTNNFASLCYYYKSWTTNQDATRGDTNALVYFTDDHAGDVRVWNLKPQTNAVSEMLVSSNSVTQWIYFYPSHNCEVAWSNWMAATNTSLVWSWVRVDDLGFELNASGTAQRWNPIRPDSWDQNRTVP